MGKKKRVRKKRGFKDLKKMGEGLSQGFREERVRDLERRGEERFRDFEREKKELEIEKKEKDLRIWLEREREKRNQGFREEEDNE